MVKTIILFLSALIAMPAFGQDWIDVTAPQVRPMVALPDTIFVAVGREINIYDSQLSAIPVQNPPYFFHYTCDVGKRRDRSWRWRPAEADTVTLTIAAKDWVGRTIEQDDVVIVSVAATVGTGTRQVIFAGDSMLANGVIPAEVDSLFSNGGGANILPIGELSDDIGGVGYLNEARGGWTWQRWGGRYTTGTDDNPFWKFVEGRLDFQAYMDSSSIPGRIEHLIFDMGGNEALGNGLRSEAWIDTAIIDYAKALADTLASATYGFPDAKMTIMLIPSGTVQPSGWGDDYGADGDWINYFTNLRAINRALIEAFDSGAYRSNVDVCYPGLWVDGLYGYPTETDSTSFRVVDNVAVTTNFVHPDTDGRYQIADALYSHLLHDFDLGCDNYLVNSDGWSTWTGWTDRSADYSATGGQADPWGGTNATLFTAEAGIDAQDTTTSDYFVLTGTTALASAFYKNGNSAANEVAGIWLVDITAASYAYAQMSWADPPVVATSGAFDISGGAISLGDGWYQLWVSADIAGKSGHTFAFRLSPYAVGPDPGDTNYCAGAQVEVNVTAPCGTYVETP